MVGCKRIVMRQQSGRAGELIQRGRRSGWGRGSAQGGSARELVSVIIGKGRRRDIKEINK